LSKFTDPVAERPLAAWLRRITASNGFEVLGRTTGHIEHVGVGRAYLEGALLVVLDVIADVAYLINRKASDPRGFHKTTKSASA